MKYWTWILFGTKYFRPAIDGYHQTFVFLYLNCSRVEILNKKVNSSVIVSSPSPQF